MEEVHHFDKNLSSEPCEKQVMNNLIPKFRKKFFGSLFKRTIIIFIMLVIQPKNALAQRGLDASTEPEINSPSAGVAGFYDTNTAKEKSLSFDFPTLHIDYGITPKLTIGTNILTAISLIDKMSNKSNRPFNFYNTKIRYKIFSARNWSASFTNYLIIAKGFIPNSIDSTLTDQSTFLTAATLNFANTFPHGTWGFSLFAAMRADTVDNKNSIAYSESEQIAKMYTLWWRHQMTESTEGELLASLCPNIQEKTINSMLRVDGESSCLGTRKFDPVFRSMINWRSSNEWLWSGGLIWFPGSDIIKYLPFVAFNYQTPTQLTPTLEDGKKE